MFVIIVAVELVGLTLHSSDDFVSILSFPVDVRLGASNGLAG